MTSRLIRRDELRISRKISTKIAIFHKNRVLLRRDVISLKGCKLIPSRLGPKGVQNFKFERDVT